MKNIAFVESVTDESGTDHRVRACINGVVLRGEWTSVEERATKQAASIRAMLAAAPSIPDAEGQVRQGLSEAQSLSTCTVDAIAHDRNHALLWARALIIPDHDAAYQFEPYWTDFCWWVCLHYPHRGDPCHSSGWMIDPPSRTNIARLDATHWAPRPAPPAHNIQPPKGEA